MSDRNDRDAFDKAFIELQGEIETEDAARYLTEAIISGRLSVYLLAEKAYKKGMTFDQFINAIQLVLGEELKTGKVDESSLEILKGFTYPDERLPGI